MSAAQYTKLLIQAALVHKTAFLRIPLRRSQAQWGAAHLLKILRVSMISLNATKFSILQLKRSLGFGSSVVEAELPCSSSSRLGPGPRACIFKFEAHFPYFPRIFHYFPTFHAVRQC